MTDHNRVHDAVTAVAMAVDATLTQESLRWLTDRDEFPCVPIFATGTTEQMAGNLDAIDVSLGVRPASVSTPPIRHSA